jgi:hypothetical protein
MVLRRLDAVIEDFSTACQAELPEEKWPQDLERRYLDTAPVDALV